MSTTIYRHDYKPSNFLIDSIDLEFDLQEKQVRVKSRLDVRRNPAAKERAASLVLDGRELTLCAVSRDGDMLKEKIDYTQTADTLIITNMVDQCVLEIETEIYPDKNTTLEGLYRSSGNFCTQCEAEGFRKITYFLDRPDVMSRYKVKIIADRTACPVLLSNGNRINSGQLENNRHWVSWLDPHPKPSYLFALVAGDLEHVKDSFCTASGHQIGLFIYTEKHNITKCGHAMQSLIAAMKWDEENYGLEYDLDNYFVVAVDDFNMGAMENKGLNIFNSKYVLADQQTATDTDFQGIESVIAHEYFHNWTGNRVTCRDWFQLSLKEGLTVFRDQQFSSDMNSAAVKRIEDVRRLRDHQFPEDAGPMAHPIRPDSFVEINNFYTLTVYEKGAEVIRMMHTLVGQENYRRGIDLYFARHDGSAVTCEDFIVAMEDASGVDLQQFRQWYSQSGTPKICVTQSFDSETQSCELTFAQSHSDPEVGPFHIPFSIALLDSNGQQLPLLCELDNHAPVERTLDLKEKQTVIRFNAIQSAPVPSLLRNFTAPIILDYQYTDAELAFLLSSDSQPYNRWEAGQLLATRQISNVAKALAASSETTKAGAPMAKVDLNFVEVYRQVLSDPALDSALCAEILTLPSIEAVAADSEIVDVDNLHKARCLIRLALALALEKELAAKVRTESAAASSFDVSAESIGKRSLENTCLAYLLLLKSDRWLEVVACRYDQASNMTDRLASLKGLLNASSEMAESRLQDFYDHFEDQRLVIDKWFSLQATVDHPEVLEKVRELTNHKDFDLNNPNRVRSLVAAFSNANSVHFHNENGVGYEFLTDMVLKLDAINPQVAARLINPLIQWKRFDSKRQEKMRSCLEQIRITHSLSRDVGEIVDKSSK